MKENTEDIILNSDKKIFRNIKKLKKKSNANKCQICFNILIFFFLFIILYFILTLISQQKKFFQNQTYQNFNINNNKSNNINIEKKETENTTLIKNGESQKIKEENINNILIDFKNVESYDHQYLMEIQSKINNHIYLPLPERDFLNGMIRKIKPKKVVEIGVANGGSSAIILNAIKDVEGAHLYSIEKSIDLIYDKTKKSGYLIKERFQNLMDKWTFYPGGITAEFIEKIGGEIDVVFIDTVHFTPGEMLDWLQVLPFLKEEAIVILHDTFLMYLFGNVDTTKKNYSNNQLLCYIRGDLILPSYNSKDFDRNIGAIKLAKEQNKYYTQYFFALATQWEYMPEEKDISIMKEFFMKYYGERYTNIFEDAVKKNKRHLNITS